MLVLTRKPGEQIVIEGGIRLTVVEIGPGRVKIGVEAPRDLRVDRAEVHDKIAASAAQQPAPAEQPAAPRPKVRAHS